MKKILIVEDDVMLSEIYKKKFEKTGDFEVVHASSGTDAIKKAKAEKPDLVLLDLVLPEMDGFDVLAELKKDTNLNNTKVVPFSNLSEEDNEKKLRELKADGFISKSEHTPQELVEIVREILKENKKKQPVRDESSDSEEFEVKINSSSIEDFSFKRENSKIKSILVIEDEEIFLDVFTKELEKIGFYVKKALDGKQGAKFLAQKEFDLVIVDIALSGMGTEQLIIEFRSRKPKAKTKFVILKSEDSSDKDIDQLKKTGIQAIIDKNKVSPKEFADQIQAIF